MKKTRKVFASLLCGAILAGMANAPLAYTEPEDQAIEIDIKDEISESAADVRESADISETADEEIFFDPADEIMEVMDEPEEDIEGIAELSATYCDLSYSVSDGEVTITSCSSSAREVEIPAEIDGYPVTSIRDWAFSNCSGLTSVTIPNSVTSIGDGAFRYCSGLTSVTMPESVTSIGDSAFYGCSGLTTVNYNAKHCTSMGSYSYPVFKNCSALTTLNIGAEVETIPSYAFRYCSGLTSVTIPESVTSIGSSAFSDCSVLTSVTIGSGVTSIDDGAFSYCRGLTSVTIPEMFHA